MMTSIENLHSIPATRALRTVAVVSKHSRPDLLDTVLGADGYDAVFIESLEHAYSHVKRVRPHMVIVCLELDDKEGFQVLSVLKLDSATSRIPVLTYLAAPEADESSEDSPRPDRDDPRQLLAVSMN